MKGPNIDTDKFAMALRLKRESQTLAEVSVETGLTEATLSRLENRKQRPDIDTFAKLCEWMGLPMDYFRYEKEAA